MMDAGLEESGGEPWGRYLLLRLLAAFSASAAVFYFSMLVYLVFSGVVESSIWLTPGVGSIEPEKVFAGGPDPESPLLVGLLPAALAFLAALLMRFGAPAGEGISLSEAYAGFGEFYGKIKSGSYSLKGVLMLAVLLSLASALAGVAYEYMYFEASLSSIAGLKSLYGLDTSGYLPSNVSWIARFISSFAQSIIAFFAVSFVLYWIMAAFKARVSYLKLYALTVYLSAIPIAFSLASAGAGSLVYVFSGTVPLSTAAFFPYAGVLLFYAAFVYGIRDLSGLSIKGSAFAVFLLVLSAALSVYIRYMLLYEIPVRILQILLRDLGVYGS